jgi:general stress protein 26
MHEKLALEKREMVGTEEAAADSGTFSWKEQEIVHRLEKRSIAIQRV